MSVLQTYGNLIARHHEILDRLFKERYVAPTHDTEKALLKLSEARIAILDSDGLYQLNTKVRKHFDFLYERTRAFQGVGNLSDAVRRIDVQCQDIRDAALRGDEVTVDDRTADVEFDLLEIHHEIDEQITSFSLMMHNGYHEARSSEERRRRNDFYHGRAKELVDIIHVLNTTMRGFFEGPQMSGLRRRYRKAIADHIERWSAQLSSVMEEMAQFLHKIKTIEMRTKRYRMISHALSKVPRAELLEALDEADQPFLPAAAPRRIGFNPRARENEEQLIQTARKIDKTSLSTQKRRDRSAGAPVAQVHVPEPEQPYEEMIIQNLLDSVLHHGKPQRVREWAQAHDAEDPSIIVIGVYDRLVGDTSGTHQMTLLPEMTGNLTHAIEDIIVTCEKRH